MVSAKDFMVGEVVTMKPGVTIRNLTVVVGDINLASNTVYVRREGLDWGAWVMPEDLVRGGTPIAVQEVAEDEDCRDYLNFIARLLSKDESVKSVEANPSASAAEVAKLSPSWEDVEKAITAFSSAKKPASWEDVEKAITAFSSAKKPASWEDVEKAITAFSLVSRPSAPKAWSDLLGKDKKTGKTPRQAVKPPVTPGREGGVRQVLNERESRYGDFGSHAEITQRLKEVARSYPGWNKLSFAQKEAIDMTFHKYGRALNGDPTYDDNFVDTTGYNQLVVDDMRKKAGGEGNER